MRNAVCTILIQTAFILYCPASNKTIIDVIDRYTIMMLNIEIITLYKMCFKCMMVEKKK